MGRRYAAAAVVPTGLVGVAAGWALSQPVGPDSGSIVRVLSLLLGSTVLGFGALGLFSRPQWRSIAVLTAGWAVAEAFLLALAAADASGARVWSVPVPSFLTFLQTISVGQIGVATMVCLIVITAVAAAAARSDAQWSTVLIVVLAAFASIARPISGHMSQQPFGSLLDVFHVLAASLWLGMLLAMALTLRTRRDWAQMLPRYSRIAFWCVVVLLVSGIANALIRLRTIDALVGTGYGHIVIAKTLLSIALVAGGWRLRRLWVSRIGDHHVQENESFRHAVIETAVMAVAFGLAAALATTP
ncbi:copper resistance D family protein [Actinomycetes bacterium M1A6_2h]